MSESEHHTLCSEIAESFEAVATKIERAIEAFAATTVCPTVRL